MGIGGLKSRGAANLLPRKQSEKLPKLPIALNENVARMKLISAQQSGGGMQLPFCHHISYTYGFQASGASKRLSKWRGLVAKV